MSSLRGDDGLQQLGLRKAMDLLLLARGAAGRMRAIGLCRSCASGAEGVEERIYGLLGYIIRRY